MNKLLLTFCISCISLVAFGQITTLDANFEKTVPINKEDIIVTIPFDSLKNISRIDDLKYSRGLIGQQLYFPKSNKAILLFRKDLLILSLKTAGIHREISLKGEMYKYTKKDISYFFPDAVVFTNVYHYNDENYNYGNFKSDSLVQDKYYTIVGIIERNSKEYKEIIKGHTPDFGSYNVVTKRSFSIEKDEKTGKFYSLNDNMSENFFDKTLAINSIVDINKLGFDGGNKLPLLKLVDVVSGDTIYTYDNEDAILLGFFAKVQQLYQGKTIVWLPSPKDEIQDYVTRKRFTIEDIGNEFKCTNVTLYKGEIVAVLENEKGKITQQIGTTLGKRWRPTNLANDRTWEYRQIETSFDQIIPKIPSSNLPVQPSVLNGGMFNDDLYFKDHLIAYEKYINDINKLIVDFNRRTQAQKDLELKNFQQKVAKEENTRLQDCISKFGQKFGPDITKRNVVLDMTKEMCVAAWGNPNRTQLERNGLKTIETWIYTSIFTFDIKYVVLVNGIVSEIGK